MITIRLSDTVRRASAGYHARSVGELIDVINRAWSDYRAQQARAYWSQNLNEYREHMLSQLTHEQKCERAEKWRAHGKSEHEISDLWRNFELDVYSRIAHAEQRRPDSKMVDRLSIQIESMAPGGGWLNPFNDIFPVWIYADGRIIRQSRRNEQLTINILWIGIMRMHEHDRGLSALSSWVRGSVDAADTKKPKLTVVSTTRPHNDEK